MIEEKWGYNSASEARRLVHTAHQLAVYFYQTHGFYVVPQAPAKPRSDSIVFPHLAWNSIHRIWDRAALIPINQPLSALNHPLIHEIKNLLDKSKLIKAAVPIDTQLRDSWSRCRKEIIDWLGGVFPQAKAIKHLHFFPTHFGSVASFNCLQESMGLVEIYLRADASLHDLVDALVGSMVHATPNSSLQLTWEEQEAVCDWLVSQSTLAVCIESVSDVSFSPTLASLRHAQSSQELRKASDAYLSSLGLRFEPNLLSLNGNAVVWKNKPIEVKSSKQLRVLRHLINHRHISQDELADIIFDNEDEYSLYVQAKFIQRLRQLLEAHGICGSLIQTVRNEGLSLRN